MLKAKLLGFSSDILIRSYRQIRKPLQIIDAKIKPLLVIIIAYPQRAISIISRTSPLPGFIIQPESTICCMSSSQNSHFTSRCNRINFSPSLSSDLQFIRQGGTTQQLSRRAFRCVYPHKILVIYRFYNP